MGMAASQARFLGLTARKSNVEYQGQQINQQRTALATESSNLFHQMMTLDVPTPPVSTDFYKTKYTLNDSALGNCSNYTIEGLTKNNNGTNNYTVKLNTVETTTSAASNTFPFTRVARTEKKDVNNEQYFIYSTTLNGNYVNFDPNNCQAYKEEKTTNNEVNNVLSIVKNNIYEVNDITNGLLKDDANTKNSYDAVLQELMDDNINVVFSEDHEGDVVEGMTTERLYFYQDASGKNCFLTGSELKNITSDAFDGDYATVNNNVATINSGIYTTLYYPTTKQTEITREVQAVIESTSAGRYSNIQIETNEKYPANLSGREFSITCTSEYDEKGYKDAFNDYEFQKNLYEQRIAEINNQTEIIQAEDKQLELRLQQLDTEQESISTEMESVTKVIEDNIQKTFDAFG